MQSMLESDSNRIYQMNRHVERAENLARLASHQLLLDRFPGMPPQWGPLLLTVSDDPRVFAHRYGEPNPANVIRFLAFDSENPNSIVACWRAAHRHALLARDAVPPAMLEEVHQFRGRVEQEAARPARHGAGRPFLSRVMRQSNLLKGMANATLTEDECWHSGRLGRLLERARMTTRLVAVRTLTAQVFLAGKSPSMEHRNWKALLQSAGAFEMFRRRHGDTAFDRATDFLILDLTFPRSVRSCVRRASESLHAIHGTPATTFKNRSEQLLGRIVASLDYADLRNADSQSLHEFLVDLQVRLKELEESL